MYLLDDILSAVDEPVARHILTHCIKGLLRDRTRVLCTHQTQFLLQTDTVVRMDQGTVTKQGNLLPFYVWVLLQLRGIVGLYLFSLNWQKAVYYSG